MCADVVGLGIVDLSESGTGVDMFSNGNADMLAFCHLNNVIDALPFFRQSYTELYHPDFCDSGLCVCARSGGGHRHHLMLWMLDSVLCGEGSDWCRPPQRFCKCDTLRCSVKKCV